MAYVGGVAIVAAAATSNPNHPRQTALIAALVLCLPAMVVALPVLYVAVSTAFNLTGADGGGVAWPVTVTYVAVFAFAAALNVALVHIVIDARRRRARLEPSRP